MSNNSKYLQAVIFSLHPAVQTQVYRIRASSHAKNIRLANGPRSYLPHDIPNRQSLLQQCRQLLYNTYYQELGWRPNPKAHTQFYIHNDNGDNQPQFCDRFDEVATWVTILGSDDTSDAGQVIACCRSLSGKLLPNGKVRENTDGIPDLDMLGYDGCPQSVRDWVRTMGISRVFEGQRSSVSPFYRRMNIPFHLFHLGSLPYCEKKEFQPVLYDPKAFMIVSSPQNMSKYVIAAGGIQPSRDWHICYEDADKASPLPIYIMPASGMSTSIQEFLHAKTQNDAMSDHHNNRDIDDTTSLLQNRSRL